jgi:uncharacterized protein YcbK (DUF882 family)
MQRRSFLLGASAALLVPATAALAGTPAPAVAAPNVVVRRSGPERRLRLLQGDDNDRIDAVFRDAQGRPNVEALLALSEFLRDRHENVSIPIEIGVLDFLSDILDTVGQDEATLLSGYRTPETNAKLVRTMGAAEGSQHLYGRALDVYVDSKLQRAVTAARAMQRGGVGWYPGSKFMHVDTGPVRQWDNGTAVASKGLKNLMHPNVKALNGPLLVKDRLQLGRTVARKQMILRGVY